jgi:DNA replication protein DnaC
VDGGCELQRSLRQLRLGGMADVLETRLRQAQVETMAPIDLISCLVSDELTRRSERLLERRRKQAGFRNPGKSLDNFDFAFNPKINRSLIFDLATAAFIDRREDVLFLGPGGTGKSHLAQAIGYCAIQQGYKVLYRETHILLDEPTDSVADGMRKEYMVGTGLSRDRTVSHHRRLRDAQTAAYIRGGSAGAYHAPIRAL